MAQLERRSDCFGFFPAFSINVIPEIAAAIIRNLPKEMRALALLGLP